MNFYICILCCLSLCLCLLVFRSIVASVSSVRLSYPLSLRESVSFHVAFVNRERGVNAQRSIYCLHQTATGKGQELGLEGKWTVPGSRRPGRYTSQASNRLFQWHRVSGFVYTACLRLDHFRITRWTVCLIPGCLSAGRVVVCILHPGIQLYLISSVRVSYVEARVTLR